MPFKIYNRRYTGSKYKLRDWIVNLINETCVGENFCDIFAGTGVISESMMLKKKNVVINDLLFSNNVIYKGFYQHGQFDKNKINGIIETFQALSPDEISENYVSSNYGNKFFSYNDAKLIGEIRERIDIYQKVISDKEFNVLLASLLYSLDKCANTVGHYDAYFKRKKVKDTFHYELIEPLDFENCQIKILREDANLLVRKMEFDIVYIDPPYNSRQYSRFYHVLENITQWQKPELFGDALKPEPQNMSEYCRSKAPIFFEDLIMNLKCKYIVVSYNNTYESKSSSSMNKISLDFITEILSKKGKLKIFEKPHQYFNAGKTDFRNHKELIFIVEVGTIWM